MIGELGANARNRWGRGASGRWWHPFDHVVRREVFPRQRWDEASVWADKAVNVH